MNDYDADSEVIITKTGFWLTTPFLLFFIGAMLYFAWVSGRGILAYLLVMFVCLPVLLAALGLYDGKRFWWARRAVAVFFFLLWTWYSVAFSMVSDVPLVRRLDAVVGFFVMALPALRYAFTGRLWVDVFLRWLSKLLTPLAGVNVWGTGRRCEAKGECAPWYGAK